jgi:signal transduction histidine kinase/predicted hydrocarbon binding protein
MTTTLHGLIARDAANPGLLYCGGTRMALLDVEGGFWALRAQLEALAGKRLADAVLQQAGAHGGACFARAFLSADDCRPASSDAILACVEAYQAAGFGRFEVEALEWPLGRMLVRAHDAFEAWAAAKHGHSDAGLMCAYTAGVLVGFANALDGRTEITCLEHTCQANGADACLFEIVPASVSGRHGAIGVDPDPLLSRNVNLLEVLFEGVPLGIAIYDRNLILWRANESWSGYVARYTRTPSAQVAPGARLFDLIPGDEESLLPLVEGALAGETQVQQGRSSENAGIVSYWDSTVTPLLEDEQVIGVVEVKADATERVLSRRQLEQHMSERTRALSALNDVIAAASGSLDLKTVLARSIERVVDVAHGEAGAIHLLGEEDQLLRLAASRGVSPAVQAHIESVLVEAGLAGAALASADPLVVPCLRGSARPLYALPADETQAYAGVPIRVKGTPIGVLSVVRDGERPFEASDISLLASIAGQVGVSVENARLHERAEQLAVVRERERLARELHDSVTQSLYSLTLLSEAGRQWAERGDLSRVEESLARLSDIGQHALKEMRLLVYQLRPLVLRREGLVGALQLRLDAVEKRAGVDAQLVVEGPVDIPPVVEEELYRIAQEALNNALKHAAASSVKVHVLGGQNEFVLRIADNGCGFDPQASFDRGGMGLTSMLERSKTIRAILEISSSPCSGTTVEVRLPQHGTGHHLGRAMDGGAS